MFIWGNRKRERANLVFTNRVIAMWAPGGNNIAALSLELAGILAKYQYVLLAELPCLGIPRLGFCLEERDREKNTENQILNFHKKGQLVLYNNIYRKNDRLGVLPATIYAYPDYPVSLRVDLDTLIAFPDYLVQEARQQGYDTVVLLCQGLMTSPMTFYALKAADRVVMPVNEPAEVAFALCNIRRLCQNFDFSAARFIVTGPPASMESLKKVMMIKDETGKEDFTVTVCEDNPQTLAACLAVQAPVTPAAGKNSNSRKSNAIAHITGAFRLKGTS